jgi:hypothetical protein
MAVHLDLWGQYRRRIRNPVAENFNFLFFEIRDTRSRMASHRLGGKDEKKQYNIYIAEENFNRGKYGRNIKKCSALAETFPFDNVRCVVQWPLRKFLKGLHGNRSSGIQEIEHWDQVASSQSKTIELNNNHLPHRRGKKYSHFWKLLLLQ